MSRKFMLRRERREPSNAGKTAGANHIFPRFATTGGLSFIAQLFHRSKWESLDFPVQAPHTVDVNARLVATEDKINLAG
jgi:hypothetical protein